MSLNHEIINLITQECDAIVGFADLRCLPDEARLGYGCGILIALPFTREAMRENLRGLPQRYYDEHEPMNLQFRRLKELAVQFLRSRGYEATANTPASVIDERTLRSPLPQKTVATLAGVGWIGKCAMLVTHEYGCAVRLTVVLTNAPLDCGVPITQSLCPPECNVCTDICPGKAPLGGLWELSAKRESFFDAHACQTAARARGKAMLGVEQCLCGLCASSCPFTKRGLWY